MTRRHSAGLIASLAVLPAAIGLGATSASGAAPSTAAAAVSIYSGNAYGTFATVGRNAVAGKSAALALCTAKPGVDKGSNVAAVDLAPLATSGAVNTTARSRQSQAGQSTRVSASLQGLSVLTDLITATSVRATSTTRNGSSGLQTKGTGSFTNLVIDGRSIDGRPAPNTVIRLAGVGRVVLNEQKADTTASTASLTVNMLHLYVTKDIAGAAKGTQLVLAHATSALGVDRAGSLDGTAYGATVFDDNGVSSGPTARVVLGCAGTNGKLKTNTAAGINVPGLLSTGTITDTARGTITADSAVAETTSRVEAVMLAGGLVTADAVKADAHASTSNGGVTLSGGGSRYTNLVVAGQPISGRVAPNTRIEVGNLTVWLHRVIRHANSIEIRMVEVVAHGANSRGIPRGTHVQVAVAEASAH